MNNNNVPVTVVQFQPKLWTTVDEWNFMKISSAVLKVLHAHEGVGGIRKLSEQAFGRLSKARKRRNKYASFCRICKMLTVVNSNYSCGLALDSRSCHVTHHLTHTAGMFLHQLKLTTDWKTGSRSPAEAKDLSSSLCPDLLRPSQPPLQGVLGVLSPAIKRGRVMTLTRGQEWVGATLPLPLSPAWGCRRYEHTEVTKYAKLFCYAMPEPRGRSIAPTHSRPQH
jgi:hypothetical protein